MADLDVEEFVSRAPGEAEEVPYLNFDDEAQEVFNDWRAAFEGEVVAGDYPAALESHFMKFRSLFASLALVFEAIDFVDVVEGAGVAITRRNAERAYAWCEYLRMHAVRIYSPMLDTPERRAEVLLKRIHRGDVEDGAKTRDIWRRGWSRLGTAGSPRNIQGYSSLSGYLWTTSCGKSRTTVGFSRPVGNCLPRRRTAS